MFQSQYEARFSNALIRSCKQADREAGKAGYHTCVAEIHKQIYDTCVMLDSFQRFVLAKVPAVQCPECMVSMQAMQKSHEQAKQILALERTIESRDAQILHQTRSLQALEAEMREKLGLAADERMELVHRLKEAEARLQTREQEQRELTQQTVQQQETIVKLNEQLAAHFQKYKDDLGEVDRLNTRRLAEINNENVRHMAAKQEQYDRLSASYCRNQEQVIQLRRQNEQVFAQRAIETQSSREALEHIKYNATQQQKELKKTIGAQRDEIAGLEKKVAALEKHIMDTENFDKSKAQETLYNDAGITVQIYIDELRLEVKNQKALIAQLLQQNKDFRSRIDAQQIEIKELRREARERAAFEESCGVTDKEQLMRIKRELEQENTDLKHRIFTTVSPNSASLPRRQALER